MPDFYIREYGKIHKENLNLNANIEQISINTEAWDYLAKYAESNEKNSRFLKFSSSTILKVRNFVGVITTPNGTQIEILPKIAETADENSANKSREVLANMLKVVSNLPFIQTTKADLSIKNQPLLEVLIGWFLQSMDNIVKRGIRRDYNRIKTQEKFLKGQLQLNKQLNEPPHKQHLFHIEYNIFSPNRAENRLIHSALFQILKWSKNTENQKLTKHFLLLFDEVPLSKNYKNDLKKWSNNRDINYYQPILPWLKLILNQQSPFTLKDKNAGISFLLPMEKLFEKYVAKILAKQLPENYSLKEQISNKYLSNEPKAFKLMPDIAIYKDKKLCCILDTKWKLIDNNKKYATGYDDKKRGISQADMYQLFSYGKKYSVNRVVLIYPQWTEFSNSIKFKLDDNLQLDIMPYSLKDDTNNFKNYWSSYFLICLEGTLR